MIYKLLVRNITGKDQTELFNKVKDNLASIITLEVDFENKNRGYHAIMTVDEKDKANGWAKVNGKYMGSYLLGLTLGPCVVGGLNYCGSYKDFAGMVTHEILHTIFREIIPDQKTGEDTIHDLQSNDKAIEWIRNNWVYKNHPDKVILHHTAVSSPFDQYDQTVEYHLSKGWGGDTGYNYFIERTGKVKTGRWEHREGAHTVNENQRSVGICLAGNFDAETPTQEQHTALGGLLEQFPLPIHLHNEYATKSCPGKNFIIKKNDMKWVIDKSNNQWFLYEPFMVTLSIADETELTYYKSKGLTGSPVLHDLAGYRKMTLLSPEDKEWLRGRLNF